MEDLFLWRKFPMEGKLTRKDFKLTDESHVLLKVPRKDNMYSVDLKNVVPQGGLTCIFAKATPGESNLCIRRRGTVVNFKTMNKLSLLLCPIRDHGIANVVVLFWGGVLSGVERVCLVVEKKREKDGE
ncbi:hypothetical protein Tco_0652806 [Tanacetum coccineum]|uniref:Uncharacterized protein n=1 Tax=Tanacetum coccineum TaxID=301880 RepID=A0ABQ4WYN3_9ASTR